MGILRDLSGVNYSLDTIVAQQRTMIALLAINAIVGIAILWKLWRT